jgi:sec-independent protein translocase protein TatA
MSIGFWQIVIVIVVILLLFGAGRIPRLMADLAKGIKAFKEGMDEKEVAHKKPAPKLAPKAPLLASLEKKPAPKKAVKAKKKAAPKKAKGAAKTKPAVKAKVKAKKTPGTKKSKKKT